ncbi:gp436 family protein [Lysobacter sp. CA199]|uniref:gp436 family protein n=1 Tax=Lysobacter sp. CA199 TaxID=3455608 RepID=UPI003F8D0671
MYISLVQLAEEPGALELAQTASTSHEVIVDAELMDRTLRDLDRSSYPAIEIAAADEARSRIIELIDEADALIDGYLARRYKLPLPRIPKLLSTWARAIVRYKLHPQRHGDERTDPVVRDYRDALKFLELVATGKFSLGIDDPNEGPQSEGGVQFETGFKVFGRKVLP